MARVILLSGFAPFGGERTNPSWQVAERLDRMCYRGAEVRSIRLPVSCQRAARVINKAIDETSPAAVVGLGQAAGRPGISLERIAINLSDTHVKREVESGLNARPVMAGTPDAYFSRLPFAAILRALKQGNIPASLSLSAGAYVCNTVMYVTLHALRRRPDAPAGFIHLPYEAAQAVSHRAAPSMSLDLMTAGVEIALKVIAQKLPDAIGKATVPRRSSSRVSGAKAI